MNVYLGYKLLGVILSLKKSPRKLLVKINKCLLFSRDLEEVGKLVQDDSCLAGLRRPQLECPQVYVVDIGFTSRHNTDMRV